jgi:excisionase family DNA binding protein
MEKLLTASQLAREIGVSRWTVSNWRRKGMPSYLIGTYYWYRRTEVDAWLKEQKV